MADAPKGARIVPIIAPLSQSHSEGSLINAPKHENLAPEQSSQEHRPGSTRPIHNKADTECLELPSLTQLGLYALPTEGDGNCLYYALSDQLYGDFDHADHIRTRLADHIFANREYFMSFIAAAGGERRAPRRAAAEAARNAYCSSSSASPGPPPSIKDKERSFDSRVAESRKNGAWGGAEEIQAFCQSFKKDVNVYTVYGIQNFRDVHAPRDEERETMHIAFHDFHHYSSVRHSDGPHTGLPCIPKFDKATQSNTTPSEGGIVNVASPWKISVIQEGLGGKYDRETIVEVLEQCRGNIDNAFLNLLGDDNAHPPEATASRAIMKSRFQPSSRSSSPFSTGSKRSADDSDEEDNPRPVSRRTRIREQKRRILPDVTVGIAFRDDQNDLVSLRLRVSPDKEASNSSTEDGREQTEPSSSESREESLILPRKGRRLKPRSKKDIDPSESSSQTSESKATEQKPRRSQRITRSRNTH